MRAELVDHASSVACDKTRVKSLLGNLTILISLYAPSVDYAETNDVHAYFSR